MGHFREQGPWETPPRKGYFSFHMEGCSGAFWGLCICEFGDNLEQPGDTKQVGVLAGAQSWPGCCGGVTNALGDAKLAENNAFDHQGQKGTSCPSSASMWDGPGPRNRTTAA